MHADLARLFVARRSLTGARGLDSVGNLVELGLLVLIQGADKEIVEEGLRQEHGDSILGRAVGVVHSHIWVSVDLPDSTPRGVGVIVNCSKQRPVGVLADLGLANYPERLVFRRSLGPDRLDDLLPLVWVGVTDVRAGVLARVNRLLWAPNGERCKAKTVSLPRRHLWS